MDKYPNLKESIVKIVRSAFSELNGYSHTIKAEVVRVYEDKENQYFVDLQPLDKHGNIDKNKPVIPKVKLPVIWGGKDRGVFALPEPKTRVRIGFDYNDPACPYVDEILWEGHDVPKVSRGSFIIQHSKGIRIEIMADGMIKIHTTEDIQITSKNVLQLLADEVYLNATDENGNPVDPHPVALGDIIEKRFMSHKHLVGQVPSTTPLDQTPFTHSDSVKVGV